MQMHFTVAFCSDFKGGILHVFTTLNSEKIISFWNNVEDNFPMVKKLLFPLIISCLQVTKVVKVKTYSIGSCFKTSNPQCVDNILTCFLWESWKAWEWYTFWWTNQYFSGPLTQYAFIE
jgi:hypothetical protein